MKKVVSIFTILAALFFIACDKVKDPIIKKATVVGSNFITKNNSAVSNFKKTLLEDYTGMRCQNCPDAAVTASNLAATYSNSLIVLAVHAGSFAKPYGNFINEDYRTDCGDDWNGTSGFGISSNPNGMVNRTNYASNGLIVLHTTWPSIVSIAKNDPFIIKLDVTTNYDTIVGALNTDVKATFKAAYTPSVMVSVVLSEDEVIGLQDVHGVETPGYVFNDMLRGSINGSWGTPLTTAPKAANDTVRVSFNNFDLKSLKYNCTSPVAIKPYTVNDKNVSVVVIAYNTATREVIQVEKVKIR